MKWARGAILLCAIAALAGALVYSQHRPRPLRVSGFIESYEIRIGSRVGGRVAEVLIDEGQTVKQGDALVKLEPFDLLQRRAQAAALTQQSQETLIKLQTGNRPEEIAAAQAQMRQMQATLQKLVAGPRQQEIDAGRAQLTLAQAEYDRALLQHGRIQALVPKGAATQDQLDEADRAIKVAAARVKVAEDDLAVLQEGSRVEDIDAAKAALAQAEATYQLKANGFRAEEIAEAAAAKDASQATLDAIDRQLQELTIVAPCDGSIEACDLRPGDLLNANAPAVSIMDWRQLWVRAYVPENRLNLQIGQIAPVTMDSFPGRMFEGKITFIARQAEFTPGNVQTPEERSKQVFRIKVMLTSGQDVLRPGMSADVWLDAPREPR
jgi:multidrug resistance efflux pump